MKQTAHTGLRAWLDVRLGGSHARALLAGRSLTRRGPESWLVGAACCLLVLLAVSGAMLLVHYRPSVQDAHASLVRIDRVVPWGALVRGVHAWSADLLVLVAGAYVFSLLVRGLHARGGELLWLAAGLELGLVLAAAFSGAVLPWSRLAHAHARVAGELLASLPLAGPWLRRVLLGGDPIGAASLGRLFGLHVGLLPLGLLVGALVCGWLRWVRARGPLVQPAVRPRDVVSVYPELLVRQAALWTGIALTTALLASVWPRSFGQAGELALPAPAGVRPPWYLAAVHVLVGSAPATVAGTGGVRVVVVVGAVVLLVLAALPWLDRRGSPLVRVAAWSALGLWGLVTAYGWLA